MLRWTSFLSHNWKAKLGALALVTILWLVVRHSISYAPSLSLPSTPPPAESPPHD